MIDTKIRVFLNSRNVKRFKDLGYKVPDNYRRGESIEVLVKDLSKGSKTPVRRICDECNRIDYVPFRDLGSRQLCASCSKSVNSKGVNNPFFGRKHSKKTIKRIKEVNNSGLPETEIIDFIERNKYSPTSRVVCKKFDLNRQTILNIINRNGRRDLLFQNNVRSSFEKWGENVIKSVYSGEIILNDRSILEGRELDVYIPELNIAFEFNGLFWHTEDKVGKLTHFKKYRDCLNKEVKLYTIWEHIYINNSNALSQFITGLVKQKERIYARKCTITTDVNLVKNFIENNHLQGYVNSDTHLGLQYGNEIVMAITIGKHHRENNSRVLNRVCYSKYHVVGGLEKLLKQVNGELITWSDNSYSPTGNMYLKAGFKLEKDLPPDYFYTSGDSKYFSKQSKSKSKTNCPDGMTEVEWNKQNGLYRVWDCGKKRWRR